MSGATTAPKTARGPRQPRVRTRRVWLGVRLIIAVLVAAALWQRTHPYTIEKSVVIDAEPGVVWSVLTDFAAYPDWNPTLTGMEGELREGASLRFANDDMTFTPTVLEVRPEGLLRWEGHIGVPGIFDGEHIFALEALPDGQTRLTQSENFRGVAVPFMIGMLRDETAPSFDDMNAALRDRAESF